MTGQSEIGAARETADIDKNDVAKERLALLSERARIKARLAEIDSKITDVISKVATVYFSENEVGEDKYALDCVEITGRDQDVAHLHLARIGVDVMPIDEDFTTDERFEAFTTGLEQEFGLRIVGVPFYYYSK